MSPPFPRTTLFRSHSSETFGCTSMYRPRSSVCWVTFSDGRRLRIFRSVSAIFDSPQQVLEGTSEGHRGHGAITIFGGAISPLAWHSMAPDCLKSADTIRDR